MGALRTRPDWVDLDLFPFTSRFVELDGNVVHYVDEGAGPKLLMVHGNPTWSFVWSRAIKLLRDRFRCIALDLPGFGLSTAAPGYGFLPEEHADVLVRFVDALGIGGATVAVQDWGGPIGLRAAQLRRDRFARLVVGNTFGWPVNGDPHFERFAKAMGGAVGTRLIGRANLFVNLMIPMGHKRRKLSKAEMLHYRMALPTPERRMPSAVFPREITRSRDFLAAVERDLPLLADLPALIVWADRDVAFRAKERERWERELPNHRTVILEGAGHYLQSDAPDEFAAAIRDWSAG